MLILVVQRSYPLLQHLVKLTVGLRMDYEKFKWGEVFWGNAYLLELYTHAACIRDDAVLHLHNLAS